MKETFDNFDDAYSHYQEFLGIARKWAKNQEDSEDVVQAAFSEVWTNYGLTENIPLDHILTAIRNIAHLTNKKKREFAFDSETIEQISDKQEAAKIFPTKTTVHNNEE